MIDWSQLEELYRASTSDNERARNTALRVIEVNIAAWIEEYLAAPRKRVGLGFQTRGPSTRQKGATAIRNLRGACPMGNVLAYLQER